MRYTLRYRLHDFDLAEGEFVVGRAATCELSLDDPMVSRNHGRLRVTQEEVQIEDLSSRNGVKVNGERIQGNRKLEHGDQILIGSQELVLLLRREAAADTLVQQPERGAGFGLLGALAEKALGLGRGDEAERLVGQQLEQLLGDVESGRAVSPEQVERATDYALRIASFTQNARWTDFIFRMYAALRRPCPAATVDQLYTVLRKVQKPAPQTLRAYLAVLRGLELGPADRFLVNRIEGLQRLIGAR
jgi:pSer/pThr/pTyr-binding forkhead associated (FHA) protein